MVRKRARPPAPAEVETFIELPFCGDVFAAERRYGISRRTLFRLAKDHPEAVRRIGARTLWLFAVIDELVMRLPTTQEASDHRRCNLPEAKVLSDMRKRAAAARAARKAKNAAADAAVAELFVQP